MTAIEIASTTSGAASAGAKPKGAETGGNGAFSAIYDSFSRETADSRTADARATDPRSEDGQTGDDPIGDEQAGKAPIGKRQIRDQHPTQRAASLTASASESDEQHTDGSGEPKDAADDLTRFLGMATGLSAGAAPAAGESQPKQSSTPLRRDILPSMPNATDADADQPGQAVRLIVIGRETHFAPVIARAPDNAAAATQPTTALPEADATNADAKPAKSKPDDAPFIGKEAVEQPRRAVPTGMAAGSAATVAVDAGLTETGALVRVADQIISQARELNAATNASMGTGMPVPPESGGPVRILRLQLQPEHLGVVTARLRIVGGVLELRLTADRQQSVEVLQQDRDGLIEALRRAGYRAEIASIEFARSQAPQAPAPAPGHGGAGGQSPQGFAGQQGGGGNPGQSSQGGNAGGSAGNGAAGNQRSHEPGIGGNDDAATRHSHEPQAIYL